MPDQTIHPRFRGSRTEPRHRGVYHYHRQRDWHPHPHQHAARQRLVVKPNVLPSAPATPAPLHHHQHTVSSRRIGHARQAVPSTELGLISTYDPVGMTAMVQVLGSPIRLIGPVPMTACAPRDLTLAGALCLVVLLDANNPRDGVVVAVWPAAGGSLGAKLTQVGVAAVAIAGASQASVTVSYPTAYAGVPGVIATSTDPAWAATVAGVTASGFTLTVHAATAMTATVSVEWMACGA